MKPNRTFIKFPLASVVGIFLGTAFVFATTDGHSRDMLSREIEQIYLPPGAMAHPLFYWSKDESLWNRTANVKHRRSTFAFSTRYRANWNYLGLGDQRAYFMEVVLWNNYPIRGIEIRNSHTNTSVEPLGEIELGDKNSADYVRMSMGQISDTYGNRYRIVHFIPAQNESSLILRVTDIYGNLSEATIPIPSS